MKFLSLMFLLICVAAYNRPHPAVPWHSTKNWRIYKLQNFNRVFGIPADSLQYLENKPLNDDSMHIFLSDAKELPSTNPAWMGCYLTSYETSDGKIRKAVISHYGGFFYCQPENAYFEVSSDVQQDWLNYLSSSYMSIHQHLIK
ncbi:hypothetical protein [Puia dinghuensis]|uniref:hypothetical protein n=1 Tax=Puia dinghuensis TaxID=1792502 RepID=UPI00166AF8C1|nr:hypothetical protein [Puia dinghuensis]